MAKTPEAARRASPAPRYHHGDLRAALLRAAEDELTERGAEGFSLRGVARRVGVSHAAPAHHFADTGALLAALAAEGFRRFLATQRAHQARAAPQPPPPPRADRARTRPAPTPIRARSCSPSAPATSRSRRRIRRCSV
jgi:AcrR family transcriptional regulator